jgi:hypothetical protein
MVVLYAVWLLRPSLGTFWCGSKIRAGLELQMFARASCAGKSYIWTRMILR